MWRQFLEIVNRHADLTEKQADAKALPPLAQHSGLKGLLDDKYSRMLHDGYSRPFCRFSSCIFLLCFPMISSSGGSHLQAQVTESLLQQPLGHIGLADQKASA